MKKLVCCIIAFLLLLPVSVTAQEYIGTDGNIKVVVVKDPYSDSRTGPELLKGPDNLEAGGLDGFLVELGCDIVKTATVTMPPEHEREYGEWNRAAFTNNALGKIIYESDKDEHFFIGLLSGSNR